MEKVLVAMSGGVDSAVAAAMLLDKGYDVTGVFMCLGTAGDPDSDTRGCCSPQDAADARSVATHLGIPLYVLNFADEFKPIIDDFINEYAAGRTPNPCIHCNSRLKFGKLVERADALGISKVATGHYARMGERDGKPALYRKVERTKDQSYALFAMERSALSRLLFPLGELRSKQEAREFALKRGLKVHDKPDSQEVCFVPDNDYVAYLRKRAPGVFRPGSIVDSSGRELGTHDGAVGFTIGQRKGLQFAKKIPMYVTGIQAAQGIVRVGTREETLSTTLRAERANWLTDVPEVFEATVQIRYNHNGAPATVRLLPDGGFEVKFHEPVHAVTPGQAAVCYDGDCLLGGGWIV